MTMTDRPLWRTQKIRAVDVVAHDVTRNKHGKWDVVVKVGEPSGGYMTHTHEKGGAFHVRTVELVDVQVVKPS